MWLLLFLPLEIRSDRVNVVTVRLGMTFTRLSDHLNDRVFVHDIILCRPDHIGQLVQSGQYPLRFTCGVYPGSR